MNTMFKNEKKSPVLTLMIAFIVLLGCAAVVWYVTNKDGGEIDNPEPPVVYDRVDDPAPEVIDTEEPPVEVVDHAVAALAEIKQLSKAKKVDQAVAKYLTYFTEFPQKPAIQYIEAINLSKTATDSKAHWQLNRLYLAAHPTDKLWLQYANKYVAAMVVADNKLDERWVLSHLLRFYLTKEDYKAAADVKKRLKILNETLVYSPFFPGGGIIYEVKPGDNLDKIGAAYDVPGAFLARINKIKPRELQAGANIKVVPGPFSVEINSKTFMLDVWAGEHWICDFMVGLGKDQSTPQGNFAVKEKIIEPTYEPAGKPKVPFSATSPLGTRWIAFTDEHNMLKHYGIHGTNAPDSIGQMRSKGCIRMRNSDVEILFDMLMRKKSKVTVK